ncbi:nuclear transcription factor Y subunit C-6 [Neltuma alba]|uniref:nuclear transcription factor Y subunit C-6 n=1 Tax=Neltuma alba TaxID=207710 RepID=UPI0010A4CF37|nr:nuclear transcription factor Y subunit C-6 [Prosopis alba]
MAEEGKNSSMRPEFPTGRVKKIMKLDPEVQRVSSEALFLVSCSTELFLRFLAEKSAQVAIEKKRKTVKLEHLRMSVKRHQPTSDFLLDSLPLPSRPVDRPTKDRRQSGPDGDKLPPPGTRRIDHFFRKPEEEAPEPRDEP